jgi:hypothetical protein
MSSEPNTSDFKILKFSALHQLILGIVPVNAEELKKVAEKEGFNNEIIDILKKNTVDIKTVNLSLLEFLKKSGIINKWFILFWNYTLVKNASGDFKYPYWGEFPKEVLSEDIESYVIRVLQGIHKLFKIRRDIFDFRINIEILNNIFTLIPTELLTYKLSDIHKSLWVLTNSHEVFLDIFMEAFVLDKIYILLKDFLKVAKKTIYFDEYKLVKRSNGNIVLYIPNTRITTSTIIAAHVASGSIECHDGMSGYRHINFITSKGSLYYGSGLTNDSETEKLLQKILTITSG